MDALRFLHMDTSNLYERLEQGEDVLDVLLRDEKGRFYEHLRFFVSIMSLADAIQSSEALVTFEKELKTKFLKKSMYPVCILLFAYVMLWVFSSAIIPQMMNSFSMDDSFQTLSILVSVMKFFCLSFALLSFSLLCTYLYLRMHQGLRSQLLYKHIAHLPVLKDYESYLLAGYLLEMQKRGISTKQAFSFLVTVDLDSVFHQMIVEIRNQLHKGQDYLCVVEQLGALNDSFSVAFKVGATSSNMETMLSSFMKQQEFVWDKTIKKLSVFLQIVSYTFVGFVVLIVYQIMLVPLSMLEQM